eukprot:scaffold11552_cov76-Skeletonema_dohrnii-CCMP3373.AAC.2
MFDLFCDLLLDMPDDMFDDDAARDAALDYEDEAQLSADVIMTRTTKRKRSTSEKGRMKEGASLKPSPSD